MSTQPEGEDYTNLFAQPDQSAAYREYRPNYGSDCPAVFARIFEHVRGFDMAIDVATGSGQAIGPLANRFKKVTGRLNMHAC